MIIVDKFLSILLIAFIAADLIGLYLNRKEANLIAVDLDISTNKYESLDSIMTDIIQSHGEILDSHCELKKEFENLEKKVDLLEQTVYNEV